MTIPASGIPAKEIPSGRPVEKAEKPKRVRKTDKVAEAESKE